MNFLPQFMSNSTTLGVLLLNLQSVAMCVGEVENEKRVTRR